MHRRRPPEVIKRELTKLPFAARTPRVPQKRSKSVRLTPFIPEARLHYTPRPFFIEDFDMTDYYAVREFKNGSSPIELCVSEPKTALSRPKGRRINTKMSYSCEDIRIRPPDSPVRSSPRNKTLLCD